MILSKDDEWRAMKDEEKMRFLKIEAEGVKLMKPA